MAKATLYLRTDDDLQDKNNTFPVWIRFNHSNTPRRYSPTPIRLKPTDLNIDQETEKLKNNKFRVRSNAKFPDQTSTEVNADLEAIENLANSIVNNHKRNHTPGLSAEFLRDEFEKQYRPDKIHKAKQKKDTSNWVELFNEWCDKCGRSPGTIKGYQTARNLVLEFLGAEKVYIRDQATGKESKSKFEYHGARSVKISDLTPEFMDNFIAWCYDVRKYEPSYILNLYVDFRLFLRKLYKREKNKYGVDPDMLAYSPERQIIVPDTSENNIALTDDEFFAFLNYEPTNTRREKARDLYIWMIATGLATVDKYIDPRFDIQDGMIIKQRQKTFSNPTISTQYIPLNEYSIALLKKYPNGLPKMHDQTLNEEIKLIAKELGIDTLVRIYSYPGGIRTEKIYPKWQVLSSHTGRKTMNAWLDRNKTPDAYKLKIIGHLSKKQDKHYSTIDVPALKGFAGESVPKKKQ